MRNIFTCNKLYLIDTSMRTYGMSVFPAENTRAKSDVFAAQNNLPKFEYVLHPRTTGFTFIVDTLRKG